MNSVIFAALIALFIGACESPPPQITSLPVDVTHVFRIRECAGYFVRPGWDVCHNTPARHNIDWWDNFDAAIQANLPPGATILRIERIGYTYQIYARRS